MITKLSRQVRARYARQIFVAITVLVLVSILAVQTGLADALHLIPLPQKQAPPQKAQEPLTDVAPPPPAVDVRVEEGPEARLQALGLDKLPAAEANGHSPVLPSDVMDLAHPPQWTETIAAPSDNPTPPDPFKAPVIAINPVRGQPDDARLKSVEPKPVVVEPDKPKK